MPLLVFFERNTNHTNKTKDQIARVKYRVETSLRLPPNHHRLPFVAHKILSCESSCRTHLCYSGACESTPHKPETPPCILRDVTRVMAKHRMRITKPVIFSKRFFRNNKNNSCPKTSLPRIRVHSRCHKGSFAFLTTKHFGRLHHYESSESGTRIFQFQIQQIPRQSGNEHTDWEKIICVEQ